MGSPLRSRSNLRTAYNLLAPLYASFVPVVSRAARRLGETWLQLEDGEVLLDVGTGTGRSLWRLAAARPNGWSEGLDSSPAMLARARTRMRDCPHRRYGLRIGCALHLPYPRNTFDALFCSYMMDVVSERDRSPILSELRRVLRPSGRAVFVYLSRPRRPVEHLWACLFHRFSLLFGGARPVHLRPSLQAGGYRIQRHSTLAQTGVRSSVTVATLK